MITTTQMFTAATVLSIATPVFSATLTPCTGSFDGPGMTACELLGRPGIVEDATVPPGLANRIDWTRYDFGPILYEITLYDETNTLRVDSIGQLVYQRETGGRLFGSVLHPRQFAYWTIPNGYIVGIEDLAPDDITNGIHGSDYDYQDYVTEARLRNVPEPTPIGLLFLAVAGWLRRRVAR